MASLAREHNIHLLTNYETTWYGSNHQVHEMLEEEKETFGDIRKIVVHDGHPGPVKLDINKEFLEWLIDPYWNGAGALTDFGCYGANLSTWLMKGQRPTSVMAVTQQIQPDLYPLVDDEATIILTYPESQTIIQASWNWNYNRKDMEVYTLKGYLHAENRTDLSIMRSEETGVEKEKISERESPLNDPFAYMIAVIRNEIQPDPADLSSLENNLIVMEILDAAMKSAKKGKKVNLK
jgi:predicted dehydrogenase